MENSINTLILDDEKNSLYDLQSLIEEIDFINIVASVMTLEDAENEILYHKPDLLLLDIEVNNRLVFELLDKLKSRNLDFSIIFVTAHYYDYLEAAIQSCGFKYPFKYLGKPVEEDKLLSLLEEIQIALRQKEKSSSSSNRYLSFSQGSGLIKIDLNEILFAEAKNNTTVLYNKNGNEKVLKMSLTSFLKKVDGNIFFPIGRWYAVRFQYIVEIAGKKNARYIKFQSFNPSVSMKISLPERKFKSTLKAYENYS